MSTPFKDRKPPTDSEIREYFKILQNDPKSKVFAPLAEGLIRRGRLEESEKLCIHGVEKNPHFSDGHLAYSRVLFYLFRYKDALNEVKKALALDSANVDAYLIAAEIFLSRSQIKAASDACMKVLDLDPTNSQALQILKKINVGNDDPAIQDGRFSTISGTAPSKKSLKSNQGPAMTNPFEQLMHELHKEASRLLEDEQPFTALSAGSQVEIPVFNEDDDEQSEEFTQPTQPIDINSIPKLPAHPPTPAPVAMHSNGSDNSILSMPPTPSLNAEQSMPNQDMTQDLLSQGPIKSANQQAPSPNSTGKAPSTSQPEPLQNPTRERPLFFSQNQITSWQRIDAAQNVIDSYRDRIDPPSEEPLPGFSRWKSMLSSLGFIAVISALVIIVVYLSTETKKTPVTPKKSYTPLTELENVNNLKHEFPKRVKAKDDGVKDPTQQEDTKAVAAETKKPSKPEDGPSETKKISKVQPRSKKKKHLRKKKNKRRKRRRARRTKTKHRTRRRKR